MNETIIHSDIIKYEIIKHLDRASLKQMAMVCRTLRILANEYLRLKIYDEYNSLRTNLTRDNAYIFNAVERNDRDALILFCGRIHNMAWDKALDYAVETDNLTIFKWIERVLDLPIDYLLRQKNCFMCLSINYDSVKCFEYLFARSHSLGHEDLIIKALEFHKTRIFDVICCKFAHYYTKEYIEKLYKYPPFGASLSDISRLKTMIGRTTSIATDTSTTSIATTTIVANNPLQ